MAAKAEDSPMKSREEIITQVEEANRNVARAKWWLNNVDAADIKQLGMDGILGKIRDVLTLLRQVDNITMDIVITIKQKAK